MVRAAEQASALHACRMELEFLHGQLDELKSGKQNADEKNYGQRLCEFPHYREVIGGSQLNSIEIGTQFSRRRKHSI